MPGIKPGMTVVSGLRMSDQGSSGEDELIAHYFQPLATDPGGMWMEARCFAGSVLFSTGPNQELGGTNDTPCHLDIPMRNCTVYLDDEPVVVDAAALEHTAVLAAVAPGLVRCREDVMRLERVDGDLRDVGQEDLDAEDTRLVAAGCLQRLFQQRQNLGRLTSKQQSAQPPPPVRCHDDQAAAFGLGGIDDGFCRMGVRNMEHGRLDAEPDRGGLGGIKNLLRVPGFGFLVSCNVGHAPRPRHASTSGGERMALGHGDERDACTQILRQRQSMIDAALGHLRAVGRDEDMLVHRDDSRWVSPNSDRPAEAGELWLRFGLSPRRHTRCRIAACQEPAPLQTSLCGIDGHIFDLG